MLIYQDGEHPGVSPTYEILPVRYASKGARVVPTLRPIEPKMGSVGLAPAVQARTAGASGYFRATAQSEHLDVPKPDRIRALAANNLTVSMAFVSMPLAANLPKSSGRGRPRKAGGVVLATNVPWLETTQPDCVP